MLVGGIHLGLLDLRWKHLSVIHIMTVCVQGIACHVTDGAARMSDRHSVVPSKDSTVALQRRTASAQQSTEALTVA